MIIRKYTVSDKPALVDLLRLNTPAFFDPAEEPDYLAYLETDAEHYFVVEEDHVIIGAGGVNYGFDEGRTARIAWDMIHPSKQGKGIGTKLITFRMNEIKKNTAITAIVVRTSQLAFKFYEKKGFVLGNIEKDYWAKGFDLYHMKKSV